MSIYLVQHGKSLPEHLDPDRGLSEEGRMDSKRIAGVAADYGIGVSSIVHSSKTRAIQTASIFAELLKPPSGMLEKGGMGPKDDVIDFAAGLNIDSGIMYVGHLPFMDRLASYLITGSADIRVIQFQNSGIVCLGRQTETGRFVIKWSIMPVIE